MPKTKAEASFETGLARLGLADRWTYKGPPAMVAGDWWGHAPDPLDTASVARLFERYGSYLELVGEDEPVGAELAFTWPSPDRV